MASREAPRPVTKEDKSILRRLRKQGYDLSVTDLRNAERQIQDEQASVIRGLTSYPMNPADASVNIEALNEENAKTPLDKTTLGYTHMGRVMSGLFTSPDNSYKHYLGKTLYKAELDKDNPYRKSTQYFYGDTTVDPVDIAKSMPIDFALTGDKFARSLGVKDTSALWTGGGRWANKGEFAAASRKGDEKGVKDDLLNAADFGSWFLGGSKTMAAVGKTGKLIKAANKASVLAKVPAPVKRAGIGAAAAGGGLAVAGSGEFDNPDFNKYGPYLALLAAAAAAGVGPKGPKAVMQGAKSAAKLPERFFGKPLIGNIKPRVPVEAGFPPGERRSWRALRELLEKQKENESNIVFAKDEEVINPRAEHARGGNRTNDTVHNDRANQGTRRRAVAAGEEFTEEAKLVEGDWAKFADAARGELPNGTRPNQTYVDRWKARGKLLNRTWETGHAHGAGPRGKPTHLESFDLNQLENKARQAGAKIKSPEDTIRWALERANNGGIGRIFDDIRGMSFEEAVRWLGAEHLV